MVRKKFDRTVVKKCPVCQQQVPVACKGCTCGHQFPTRGRASSQSQKSPDGKTPPTYGEGNNGDGEQEPMRRRTVRTKRVRPDFFNPLELEYSNKKVKKPEVSKPEVSKQEVSIPEPAPESPKKKRGRPKGSLNRSKSEEKPKEQRTTQEEDLFSSLPPEKALQYSVILAELNRKMLTQNFKPP
ncbi:UPF0547 protein C16orf87 homolog isoform X1 [Haliotis rufescens]|uniref:UPF0547 protein C16orf87 homolog isoform X1 n=1 Tax=Haliotis rufescens TaxID=6454 RepID=UPI001EAF8D9B|nr:UPF0547 protein C16orf87 homolog isoform X1 [Haliotis rufescens]